MHQPKVNIPGERIGYLLEGLSLFALAGLIGLATFYYPVLPAKIPVHFGISGEADGYGPESLIWSDRLRTLKNSK